MSVPVIEVSIWGERVGALAADPTIGVYAFAYLPSWRRRGIELAPVMMPLSDGRDTFLFPNLPEATFHRLPGMLADALPDDFGNALIDAWMAEHGVQESAVTTLDRLAYMGKRGMGALEFKPARGSQRESRAPLKMKSLVEEARKLVSGNLAIDAHAKAALANMIKVGTSAGGARAKAVIAWNPKTNEIRSGQFDVAPGFEHWILKFDGVGQYPELGAGEDYGRIEYAYYKMATAAGIRMSDCRLLEENGRAHFMTKRFDRDVRKDGTVKHHMQSLCALSHLDFKQRATHAYAQLFITVAQLGLGDEAMAEIFRRMAFNVMARNCDDHTKNFGFLLKQGQRWELAPAYDVTHAYNPRGEWTYQHLMSVNGKFEDITKEDLMVEADRFSVRRAKDLLADVRGVLESWTSYANEARLGKATTDRVSKDFRLL
ncbi:MAG TPA: type II toxin-antitoxin system HipA family toxin [Candidatus Acidoferrales bacterium]|nr:type II toxin-antitoxin system HipA family toxin [Candidatus Acidoferrales bacterium]